MACACNGKRNRSVAQGGLISGYEYISPSGEKQTFLTPFEAKKAQRRNGGGTIHVLKNTP